jgi:hypothetical protein
VLVQVGYAVAAFAIGVAIGGLTRSPAVAMGGAAFVFALIRWVIAVFVRRLYLATTQARSVTGSSGDTTQELNPLNPSHTARIVEFAIYLGIAALALSFAWVEVRRRRRV